MNGLNLTERQRTTVTTALTLLSVVAIVWVISLFLILLGRFVSYFSGVLLPLVTAGIVALVIKPYYDFVLGRVRVPALAFVVVFLSVFIPFFLVINFFGGLLADQVSGFIAKVPLWYQRIREYAEEHAPGFVQFWHDHGLGERLRKIVNQNGERIMEVVSSLGVGVWSAGTGFFRYVTGLLGWVIVPVYLFFFLTGSLTGKGRLESLLPFLKEETRHDVIYLVTEFINIVVAFFRGQLVISLIQGTLYAVGFMLVGLQFGGAIGMFMGLMNMIPYLGSMMGLLIALPMAFFQDGSGWGTVAGALVVIGIVQSIEGYFLTPKIMGDRTGLHPMAIIFGIFFWSTALNGIMGMILAIPLTAFLVVFWRLLKAKYIKELV